ncbi:hypothetical protein [Rasiella sp. SM2506]|uniref:hypothetical protein n=1 Tax=Rasiella sp. SM2506 TaxID=3423914 RepID=UPI003D7B4E9F
MKSLKILSLLILCLFLTNCEKDEPISGCTDPLSDTYNSEAVNDDGSCSYFYGGREKGQIDVAAEVDLNNEYDIYIDNEFVGRLDVYFPNGAFCGAPENPGRIFDSGTHFVRAIGNGGDEIREGSVNLSPQECDVVLVENLQLVSTGGGGTGGGGTGGGGGGGTGGGGTGGGGTGGGGTGGGGTGGGDPIPGKVKFWRQTDLGCGIITVNLSGEGSASISGYFSNGPGDCGNYTWGGNFDDLAPGTYSFTASCSGASWSGTVGIDENRCTLFQLGD